MEMTKKSKILHQIIITALTLPLLAFILSAMLDHNPQGEFMDYVTGEYHLDAILPILIFWFIPQFVIFEAIYVVWLSSKFVNDKTKSDLKQKAEISIREAKDLILKSIPNNEIVAIYLKGSYIQGEMLPDSDIDVVVILKSEEYLPAIYKLTEECGISVNPPFQIVAYTMKELETGEKASNRIKSTTAVSRFNKHLESLPLIYGAKPGGHLFMRTDEKDLSVNIQNFRNMYIPDYKEGKFGFKQIVKQTFWLAEADQRLKGLKPGYSWQKLADSTGNPDDVIHLALKYRKQDKISKEEESDFMERLEKYLNELESKQ